MSENPTPTCHSVKCWDIWFDSLLEGRKTFEVRFNDRNYKVGDMLNVQEWRPAIGEYTGRMVLFQIIGVFSGLPGVKEGYVVLAIVPVKERKDVN